MAEKKRVAIFIAFSGQGGVERMITNLARGMIDAGVAVDMVLIKARGEHIKAIPAEARVFRLKSKHTATSLLELIRYLRNERPDALLAVKHRAIKTAVLARRLAGLDIPLAGRLGTTVSAALEGRGALKQWLWYRAMRSSYRHVDTIVAVSQGVADDVHAITGLSAERPRVIRNPVITPELFQQAAEPLDHPWFSDSDIPVILGAGRLTRQKDFPTLLRAFALVRQQRPCRLMVLGEGNDRAKLEQLAGELGISDDVEMPGFVVNPFKFIARASLFVLSSLWEGSPNSLTEALALGTPVVSTDCPSGPKELLAGGRYGPLVQMGDHQAMAEAIIAILAQPLDKATLRAAVADYNRDACAAAYLQTLGIPV
jgi:glycosyltransferase involved in cell wall biosynthesis